MAGIGDLLGTVKTEVEVGFDTTSALYLAAALFGAAALSIILAYILFKVL